MEKQRVSVAVILLFLVVILESMADLCGAEEKKHGGAEEKHAAVQYKDPTALVKDFYAWYMKDQKKSLAGISQWKDNFEEKLYEELMEAMKKSPAENNSLWLDFDPFLNAQVYATSFAIGKTSRRNNTATVAVSLKYEREGKQSLKVFLIGSGGVWRIANLIYDDNTTLYRILRTINRKN
jgi:hypothetical protein